MKVHGRSQTLTVSTGYMMLVAQKAATSPAKKFTMIEWSRFANTPPKKIMDSIPITPPAMVKPAPLNTPIFEVLGRSIRVALLRRLGWLEKDAAAKLFSECIPFAMGPFAPLGLGIAPTILDAP